jgi:hypothetical protein
VGQASPGPFPQNLSFELREYCEQDGHGAPGGCRQIQCLGQGDETDTEMIQLLQCGE